MNFLEKVSHFLDIHLSLIDRSYNDSWVVKLNYSLSGIHDHSLDTNLHKIWVTESQSCMTIHWSLICIKFGTGNDHWDN